MQVQLESAMILMLPYQILSGLEMIQDMKLLLDTHTSEQ